MNEPGAGGCWGANPGGVDDCGGVKPGVEPDGPHPGGRGGAAGVAAAGPSS
ncbi:MAG: hypothetical protein ACTHN0_13610 [Aquihabitans sp.]